MSEASGNSNPGREDDLQMLASADAVGALSEKEQQDLEYQEAMAEPRVRKAMWGAREDVMKQMRDDLPDVEPESSLKHRVLASVLRAIESDFVNSTSASGPLPGLNASMIRGSWIERLVGGRVSPIWRVAALVLMTISVGLFWNLTAAMNQNGVLLSIARDNELERFEGEVGSRTVEDLMQVDAVRIAFRSLDLKLNASALFTYLPSENRGLLYTTGLPELDGGAYFLRIDGNDPLEDPFYIRFDAQGKLTGIDVMLPSEFDIDSAEMWVVSRDDEGKVESRILVRI